MHPHVDQSVDVAAKFGFIDAALGIKRNHVRREDAVDRSWCIHIHIFERGATAIRPSELSAKEPVVLTLQRLPRSFGEIFLPLLIQPLKSGNSLWLRGR